MAIVATANGVTRLWRYTFSTGSAEPIEGTDGAQLPAWKHTGNVIAFFADGGLKQIAFPTGEVMTLVDVAQPAGATWLPNGSLLFATAQGRPLRRMLEGRETDATTLSPGDRAHVLPMSASGSADGDQDFTYVAIRDNGRRVVRLVQAGVERELTDSSSHAQLVDDVLLHVRDGVLLAQRWNAETGQLDRAAPLVSRVAVAASGRGMFAASRRLLVSSEAQPRARVLAWYDPVSASDGPPKGSSHGEATARTTPASEPGDLWQVRLSPDDRSAAVTVRDPLLRTLDIVVMRVDETADVVPLTPHISSDSDPVWSPDGRQVLFRSMQKGQPRLFTRVVNARGAEDVPVPGDVSATATDWIGAMPPGGRSVLIQTTSAGSGSDIGTLNPLSGEVSPIAQDPFNETDARWSPDRAWVAYVSDESGQPDVYVRPTGSGLRVRVSSAGGVRPRWRRDGQAIYFVRGAQVMRADRVTAADGATRFATPVAVLDVPGLRDFDMAHGSDRLMLLLPVPGTRDPVIRAIVDWNVK